MLSNDSYQKYSSYSVEDLLQDDSFIAFRTHPTEELEAFWDTILKEGIVSAKDYELACYFIRSVQTKTESVTNEEVYNLWEDIEVANKANLRLKKSRFRISISIAASVAVLLTTLFVGELLKKQVDSDEAPIYNELIVPTGKQSMITLSDGSQLWINAGTRVIYPAVFDKDRREIYVDGEVFMDVAHDANRPFIVKTGRLQMEVLGTTFNVMAYEKDTLQNIVLVSGHVKVHTNERKETILDPNEMLTLANDGSFLIKQVEVTDYISWKSGLYKYESERLDVILKRLSRYYGQEIAYSPQVAHLRCTGKLDLKEDLLKVLSGISQTAPIQFEYENETYRVTDK